MKRLVKTALVVLVSSLFGTAGADVVQVWECSLHDGKTEADIMKASSAWLAAARNTKGGDELEAYHEFPLAADAGSGGFNFVLIAPNPETWGVFMGAYPGSEAAAADDAWSDVAECSGSSLWNSVEVE